MAKHNADLKHCDFQCAPGKNIFCRDSVGITNALKLNEDLKGYSAAYEPTLYDDLKGYTKSIFQPSLSGVYDIAQKHREAGSEMRKAAFQMYYKQTLDAWAWKRYYERSTIPHQQTTLCIYIRQQSYKWERIWARARELAIATMGTVTIAPYALAQNASETDPGSPVTSSVVGVKRKIPPISEDKQ